jgi:hypothetical protein
MCECVCDNMALVFNDHSKADSFFGRHSNGLEYFGGLVFTSSRK